MDQKKAGKLISTFCIGKSPEKCKRCKIKTCSQKGGKTWKKRNSSR